MGAREKGTKEKQVPRTISVSLCTAFSRAVGSCQFRLSYCRMFSLMVGSPFIDCRLLLLLRYFYPSRRWQNAKWVILKEFEKKSDYALCLNAVRVVNCWAICTVCCREDRGRIVALAYSFRSRFVFWSDISVVGRGIYRGTANSAGHVIGVHKIISDGQ